MFAAVIPLVAAATSGLAVAQSSPATPTSALHATIASSADVLADLEAAMPAWLREAIFGVAVWKYLAVLLLVLIAITLQKIVVTLIGRWLGGALSKGSRVRLAAERASRPIGGLAMAGVFHVGLPLLEFPETVQEVSAVATEALAAFSLVWLGYRLIDVIGDFLAARAERTASKLDDQIVPLVTRSLKVFVCIIGGIFILQNLSVDVGSLLAGLGLGGLAFALAARDTVANFFGSVMIFLDRPFQIGDWVVVAGVEGTVEQVGFRSTRVRTFYNSLVTVPNARVVDASIDNYGARQYRRYSTKVGLTYDTSPDRVQAFCEGVRAIIARMPETRKDYYLVEFSELGESGLTVMIYCFFEVTDWNAEMRARHHMNLELLRLAQAIGVNFAFPTQTLHVDSLANLGGRAASPPGPETRDGLAKVVDAFGPRSDRARGARSPISEGYDNSPRWRSSESRIGGEG